MFLLKVKTAQRLYHEFAEHLPIIDYHNHLSPQQMARNYQFKNLTEIWLEEIIISGGLCVLMGS
ncbi:MAG: glucuronate isomerase [Chitinophagales bacterium]